eukprot:SAG31_NODE_36116_length_316_cov_0.944700_1_plen_53_part_01
MPGSDHGHAHSGNAEQFGICALCDGHPAFVPPLGDTPNWSGARIPDMTVPKRM